MDRVPPDEAEPVPRATRFHPWNGDAVRWSLLVRMTAESRVTPARAARSCAAGPARQADSTEPGSEVLIEAVA
jgi:hypothetical protein